MKLLFDQNLSRKLIDRLATIFPESSHVQFHGLAEKTDTEIWEFAKANSFCIVTTVSSKTVTITRADATGGASDNHLT